MNAFDPTPATRGSIVRRLGRNPSTDRLTAVRVTLASPNIPESIPRNRSEYLVQWTDATIISEQPEGRTEKIERFRNDHSIRWRNSANCNCTFIHGKQKTYIESVTVPFLRTVRDSRTELYVFRSNFSISTDRFDVVTSNVRNMARFGYTQIRLSSDRMAVLSIGATDRRKGEVESLLLLVKDSFRGSVVRVDLPNAERARVLDLRQDPERRDK